MEKFFDFSRSGLAETLVPSRIVEPLAWIGHIPFAYYLVEKIRPRLIVELGVHTGNSFFAFCDAVKALKLEDTYVIGIDTFKGDKHAGFYDHKVLDDVMNHMSKNYTSNMELKIGTFDQCSNLIDNYSIDILHIDGCHTYEETRHNFEIWKRKVKSSGFILFHDTVITRDDFGVWKFWQELEKNVQFDTFNFIHSCGLGVLKTGYSPFEFNDPEKAMKHFEDLGNHIQERIVQNRLRMVAQGLSQSPVMNHLTERRVDTEGWGKQDYTHQYPLAPEECFVPGEKRQKYVRADGKPSICLTFICRNNESTIERMIKSCASMADCVVAVDTGSTDQTKGVIAKTCTELTIPYEIFSDEWVNFGHNRTLMMQHARDAADYLFVMDTDEELEITSFDRSDLTSDIAMIPTHDGTSSYVRDRIFSNQFTWKWIGAAHEFAQGEGSSSKQTLEGLNLKLYPKPNNNHIQRNYDLLLGDYQKNPHDTRTLFYLGQSAFDLGKNEEALKYFKERSDIPFYPEESWYALYRQGQLYERMQRYEEAEVTFLKAYSRRPSRMEPIFALAYSVSQRGDHGRACPFYELAIQIPYPKEDQLFVEDYLYEYNCAFWYTISLYYTGRFQQSFDLAEKLANEKKDKMPADIYDRHLRNIMWCEMQLVKQGWRERFIVCPADLRFDGMGDNLLHSHLAGLAKDFGYKKVYLSSLMKFKTPGTKEMVYLDNICVDGEIERYGLQCENQWAKNILAGDVPSFDMEYMKLIAFSHGFYREGMEHGPVASIPVNIYLPDQFDFPVGNLVIFDGNGKTSITDYRKVLKYFNKVNKPDYQLVFDGDQTDVQHGNTTLKRIDLPDVPKLVIKNQYQYIQIVKSCRELVCLTSATAILAAAFIRKATVLTDTEWLNQPMPKCHMRPLNEYVNLDEL